MGISLLLDNQKMGFLQEENKLTRIIHQSQTDKKQSPDNQFVIEL